MRKITHFLFMKGGFFLLFMMVQVALFSQTRPELMYYVFNAAGNQTNYALTPVGTNPAPLLGYSIGGSGQFGTGLIGNGGSTSSNYLNTGWATNLGTGPWTISMWLNGLPSNTTLYYIFGDPNANSFRCFLGGAAGAGNVLLRGGGLSDVLVSGVAPGPTVVTFVYTGTQVKYYKNGVLSGSVANSSANINGSLFKVAGYSTGLTGMPAGSILDEFRMYNRALSDAEVTATWDKNLLAVGSITGTVTNSYNGNPIAGATVTCGSANTTTGANGTYNLTNVYTGNQVVHCSAANFIAQDKTVMVVENQAVNCDFALDPIPAYVSGVVRNASNNAPVVGAKITIGSCSTYSVTGGVYNLNLYPVGTFSVTGVKAGFEQTTIGPYTFTVGNTFAYDINLNESVNAPGPFTAALNTAQTAVNLNWQKPWGYYEQIYDDGIKENLTLWTTAGNMNAVKFTALNTPCQVTGGHINIGSANDYPSGANPLVPFQIAVYDATGNGGTPGNLIAGPFDITPTALGWVEFSFPSAVDIPSGNFYLVQIQGGNSPNAAGCAIDTTSTQLRSYQKFVTGNGPWVPTSGNLMIRAIIYGTGGPLLDIPGNTETLQGYQVWRLTQGNETNPGTWTSIAQVTGTSTVDNSWPTLDCGPYMWAVEAQYTGNRWSTATFSNAVGKCWTAAVTVNVSMSCDSTAVDYTTVKLQNVNYP
ncbi:MAG: carboxypeptidase regulatory-like domain-containing protein, partial [Bacteroidota bacterium]|nr:carboxypeptidase regulatory-like domain-containing protein [Bacteroidota bacterium]